MHLPGNMIWTDDWLKITMGHCQGVDCTVKFYVKVHRGKISRLKEMLILIIPCMSDRNLFILLNFNTKVTLIKDRSFAPS